MLEGFANAPRVPELRRRLVFTAVALAVYRLGVWIPTPGIDGRALADYFAQAQGLVDLVNAFSGGALERFSIFALGIMPYISASIILQLLTVVIPHLEKLSKEGELGRRKITQYTRYGTVALALMQSFFISVGLESIESPTGGGGVVFHPGWGFRTMAMITLTTGTAFIMWLGEQITERGIGNGISLIIFAGIVTQLPSAVFTTLEMVRVGEMSILVAGLLLLLAIAVVAAVIFMERGQRRIPIQHAKRLVGRRMYAGQSTHLPLKVNTAGVIPPIFASSLLLFPATIVQFFGEQEWARSVSGWINPGGALYDVLYVALIIFFCYFYTAIQFNPQDVADNLKKVGAYIPGIRPGQRTAEYIERVLSRITLPGALYIAAVCVLPTLIYNVQGVSFYLGGTALLIVVGVALDTIAAIETHLISRSYEGFMKKGRIRGRR
ncbi:MAG TPA: preprotein translocase subunit SecY [Candidatus Limnocylindria bacterium]|nr:preprotein translocase subunit SecY [Candidatus Limnocylindria bacterium]